MRSVLDPVWKSFVHAFSSVAFAVFGTADSHVETEHIADLEEKNKRLNELNKFIYEGSAAQKVAGLESDLKYAVGQLEIERRENQLCMERRQQAEADFATEREQHNLTIHVAAHLINPLSQVHGLKTLTDAIVQTRQPREGGK